MSATFTYHEFQRLLEDFTDRLPGLLARMPLTAHLVRDVESLLDSAESPFTVAVLGQMRSGKSTLLNALMGRDLAVTDVNETTATTNWFKFSDDPEACDQFRVHWKEPPDGAPPEELHPLSEIRRWIGDSQDARNTRFLEFFAPSPFLKRANIVDTPGTRSLIQDHSEKARDLISGALDSEDRQADRQHEESRKQARHADAILYVLVPTGRENDESALEEFDRFTRMPGSHPYNSVGIVHKWECLVDSDDALDQRRVDADDPWARVQLMTADLETRLQEKLSCVIPVSAPLAICEERLRENHEFWRLLNTLGRESSSKAIGLVTLDDEMFVQPIDGCALEPRERIRMRTMLKDAYPRLPWATLQVLIRTAHPGVKGGPKGLRERIAEMSGMERLRHELHTRYFARAKMIKAFSILAKAWAPCQIAQTRLRNRKIELNALVRAAQEVATVLQTRIRSGDDELSGAAAYVNASLSTIDLEFRQISELLRTLSDVITPIEFAFEDMNQELKIYSLLEEHQADFTPDDLRCLRALLGGTDPSIVARMRPFARDPAQPSLLEVDAAIEKLQAMGPNHRNEASRAILDFARRRMGQIGDWVEEHGPRSS